MNDSIGIEETRAVESFTCMDEGRKGRLNNKQKRRDQNRRG